jgi:hypothetical protein
MLNSKPPTLDYYQKQPNPHTLMLIPESMLVQSIGELKEPFLQLKTKDNADHAGPSPPPDHWNQSTKSKKEPSETSPNNNWLIAQPATEIKVAMEV